MLTRLILVGVAAVGLVGCTASGKGSSKDPNVPVTTPYLPTMSSMAAPIADALACVKQSRALDRINVGVAIHADGTGKQNSTADGATGDFLPQGTTAVYASQAVMMAGANAYNYYELNTERAMRTFASADGGQKLLTEKEDKSLPQYILSTSFTALDFVGGPEFDIRVAGVGPHFLTRGAVVEATAEIYRPGTRAIQEISAVHRLVKYREIGAGVGTYIRNNLVTGGIVFSDQQRLQEATRDMVALSVADVLTRLKPVPSSCRKQVVGLLLGNDPPKAHSFVSASQ